MLFLSSHQVVYIVPLGYYTFIKKKPDLVEKLSEAIFDIIWSYVYPDFFSLVRKAVRILFSSLFYEKSF